MLTYYEKNKEVIKARSKARYWANKESILAGAKQYRESHKEEQKSYREEHKEERRAWSRIYDRSSRGRFQKLKSSASERNLMVDLTFEEYCELVDNKRCYYGGCALPVTGSGLDRLDNRFGYRRDNVVPCCKKHNFIKGLLEQAGFHYPRIIELMKELEQA